jgi:hypothetical protein
VQEELALEPKAYIFNLTIGRRNLEIEIDERLEGFEGHLTFNAHVLPKKQRELLQEFDSKLITDYRSSSVGPAWKGVDWEEVDKWDEDKDDIEKGRELTPVLMTPKQHDDFINRVNTQYKQEYDQLKTEIVSHFEENVLSFKKLYYDSYPDNPIDFAKLIPSKKEYEESFYLKFGVLNS